MADARLMGSGGRRAVAIAAVLAAAGAQACIAGHPAVAQARVWDEGPLFNDPLGTAEQQYAIRTRLLELTNAALPGSSIKVAVYHVWETTVSDALVAAKNRGVNVQIVLDSSSVNDRPTNPVYEQLKAALGTSTAARSFVTLCPKDTSCLGDPRFGKSIMHNKFWLFSAVEGATDVVVQTTSNATPSASTRFYNDALQLPGNPVLYRAYANYFDEVAAKVWQNWDYRTVSDGRYKTYFFPRAGTTTATDTLYSVLDNVACAYKDASGATRHSVVRAAIFQITRQAIADQLVALKKAGCSVSIEYATSDSGTWKVLHAAGAPSRRCLNDDRDPLNPGGRLATPYIVHTKYVLIDGVYDGARDKIAFTGSQNASGPALRENDEAYVKIDDDSVHDTYRAHFDRVWKAAWPGTADGTNLCKGVKVLPQDGEPKP